MRIVYIDCGPGHSPWRVVFLTCCGCDHECRHFTNTCVRPDYNGSGARLAPRCWWGEATGEHPSDCVGPFGVEK